MKNSKLSYMLVGLMFVIFNVIAFVIPTPKLASFWIAYVFTIIAFLVQIFIFNKVLKKEQSLKSKFLGFPLINIGITFLVIQIIAFFIFMMFPNIQCWITLVVCSLILGISGICLITVEIGRNEITRVENKVKEKVFYIKELQIDVEIMVKKCTDKQCKEELEKLVEAIKYSDPMSSEKLQDIENEIKSKINELGQSCSIEKINEVQNLIKERNEKCKILK